MIASTYKMVFFFFFFGSPSGNRTQVSRMTDRDTHHYTTEDKMVFTLLSVLFLPFLQSMAQCYNTMKILFSCHPHCLHSSHGCGWAWLFPSLLLLLCLIVSIPMYNFTPLLNKKYLLWNRLDHILIIVSVAYNTRLSQFFWFCFGSLSFHYIGAVR